MTALNNPLASLGQPGPDPASTDALELDFIPEEPHDWVSDLLGVHGRLRGLLRANAAVTADLSLPVVLNCVAEAARDLLNARYAAIGVIRGDGQLEAFVQSGVPTATVDLIGDFPHGNGILDLLIRDPVPIRLNDLVAHPASSGSPPGHPPMRSFLGVPIREGDAVFGNLYVAERTDGGQFSAEDEQLAAALAVTAGGAIVNARLFAESEQRRRWLIASASLTNELLAVDTEQPLSIVAKQALAAAEADFAIFVLPHGDAEVIVAAGAAELAAELVGRTASLGDSLSGQAIRTGKATLVTDHYEDPSTDLAVDIGPLMVVPLTAGQQARGAVMLGRLGGRQLGGRTPFTQADLTMAASFATQAVVALELIDSRNAQLQLSRMEDRDRIAADLHDHVIQELFAVGMGLQGLVSITEKPSHVARILEYINAIDQIIGSIRTTIFEMRADSTAPSGLKAQILDIARQHTVQLGYSPNIRFAGPLDVAVTGALAADTLAVIREATSNCARHAHATRLDISINLTNCLLLVEIIDNGRGLGTSSRSSGLSNMRRRAETHCGTLSIAASARGGTHLTWTATTPTAAA
jgi:signal transduction histidine kinase